MCVLVQLAKCASSETRWYRAFPAYVVTGGGRRQTDAVFENTFLHISLLLLGSAYAFLWEQSQNVALILQYATISLKIN